MFQMPGSLQGSLARIPTIIQNAMSPILDGAFGSTQGSILYRDVSAWKALPIGANQQVLQSWGPGVNPAWVYPQVRLLNTLTFTNVTTAADTVALGNVNYDVFRIIGYNWNVNTSAVNMNMHLSTDGGSTYFTSAGNYLVPYGGVGDPGGASAYITASAFTARAGINNTSIISSAGQSITLDMLLMRPSGVFIAADTHISYKSGYPITGGFRENLWADGYLGAPAANAIRWGPTSGSMSGTIKIYGMA